MTTPAPRCSDCGSFRSLHYECPKCRTLLCVRCVLDWNECYFCRNKKEMLRPKEED